MRCDEALALIPSYLDGELTESQAAPLRRHLLDCQACRAGAQGDKNLKRWFQPDSAGAIPPPVPIPQGFAARVARRAFAGDTGEPEIEIVPAATAAATIRRPAPRMQEDPLLRFVLQATAAAALVVLALSLALRSQTLPSGTSLRASDGRNEISAEQAIERLEQMNGREVASKALSLPATATTTAPATTKTPPKPEEARGK
jgi:anti-sigma factor RsiW